MYKLHSAGEERVLLSAANSICRKIFQESAAHKVNELHFQIIWSAEEQLMIFAKISSFRKHIYCTIIDSESQLAESNYTFIHANLLANYICKILEELPNQTTWEKKKL